MENAAFEGTALHESVVRRRALIQKGHKIQAEELKFLEAVRNGDILGLRALLQVCTFITNKCSRQGIIHYLQKCVVNYVTNIRRNKIADESITEVH